MSRKRLNYVGMVARIWPRCKNPSRRFLGRKCRKGREYRCGRDRGRWLVGSELALSYARPPLSCCTTYALCTPFFLAQLAPMAWCPLAHKWALRTHSVCPVRREQTAKMAINKVRMAGSSEIHALLCSCCLDRVTEVRFLRSRKRGSTSLPACLLAL